MITAAPTAAAEAAGYFADLLTCLRNPGSPRMARFLAPLQGPLPAFWPTSVFVLAMLGQRRACLDLVRRIYLSRAGRAQAPTWVVLQTMMQPLWNEPDLRDVMRQLGLIDFWRARGADPLARSPSVVPRNN